MTVDSDSHWYPPGSPRQGEPAPAHRLRPARLQRRLPDHRTRHFHRPLRLPSPPGPSPPCSTRWPVTTWTFPTPLQDVRKLPG